MWLSLSIWLRCWAVPCWKSGCGTGRADPRRTRRHRNHRPGPVAVDAGDLPGQLPLSAPRYKMPQLVEGDMRDFDLGRFHPRYPVQAVSAPDQRRGPDRLPDCDPSPSAPRRLAGVGPVQPIDTSPGCAGAAGGVRGRAGIHDAGWTPGASPAADYFAQVQDTEKRSTDPPRWPAGTPGARFPHALPVPLRS